MKHVIASLAALLTLVCVPARADYVVKDGNGNLQTIRAGTIGSFILPWNSIVDSVGNSIFTAPGTPNANFAMPVQGVTGGVALPVSIGSLPLPSGAATAAKQPALGTAGSSSTDVISVQGIAGGVAQPVTMPSLPAFASTPAFNLSQIGGTSLAFGQAAPTSSLPVVLANDIRPGTGTITIVDSASSSTTGQNGTSIITGSPTASSFVLAAVNGLSTARIQLSGTWTGTIAFEQSIDGGTTYGVLSCHGNGTTYSLSAATANGIFDCEAAGATQVRARATAAMTGTATVTMTFTVHPGIVKVQNSVNVVGAPFTPNSAAPITLSATNVSASAAIPTGTPTTATIKLTNIGASTVSCTLGVGSATATANEDIIQAGGQSIRGAGSNTWVACINQAGTSPINVVVVESGIGTGSDVGGGLSFQGTSPWVENVIQWASGTIGAMANYGTSPGAVLVPGTNSFTTGAANFAAAAAALPSSLSAIGISDGGTGCAGGPCTIAPVALTPGTFGTASSQVLSVQANDPCTYQPKLSAPISVTTATTTSLVAVSGTMTVYVCGFSMTIAPSATAADTAALEYGTSTTCTTPVALTGTYGAGDLTSAVPVTPINYGNGGFTVAKTVASQGVCILTAGTAVNVQGVLTYVQQ